MKTPRLISDHKYPQWPLCLQPTPIWSGLCPCHISEIDGHSPTGVPGVACYFDDILVSSAEEESHLNISEEVFNWLEKHGFRIKLEKCEFLQPCIEYLGHIVSKDGIKPVQSKIEAIVHAPTPENVQQLRSFLGLTNYYGKFIPNLATLLHPFNALLQANKKWHWSSECKRSFKEAKDQIALASILTHYNPSVQDIQEATRRDAVLSKVYRYVQGGWPSQVADELRPYRDCQTELTTESGCLMWGIQMIIPKSLQAQVLKSLHENHPGITRIKMTACSYFLWQGLDKNSEEVGNAHHAELISPTHPQHHFIPGYGWIHIHIEFAGPVLGHMFLLR